MNIHVSNDTTEKEKYFDFVFTEDGSTGLYNYKVDDIYHSKFGAKSEAWEKFVLPLHFEKNFKHKKSLKVLDICYGIGYNTKALLKKILQSDYKGSVKIDILEYDKNLVLISPFIKDGFLKNNPEISYILCTKLSDYMGNPQCKVIDILTDPLNKKFIEPFYRELIKKYSFRGCKYTPEREKKAFLHNIYYHCISNRIKKPCKTSKINSFDITPYFDDARTTIKALNEKYDIVFLDAFTPAKQPVLWTINFFEELFRITSDDCIIVTYSNSCSVRHAMCAAGFSVGKLFDKQNRHCGTIASKNPDLIINKLDEYGIGLMNTKAGIYYLDKYLNSTCEEILLEYENRKKELNLEPTGQYIKRYKRNKETAANV